MRILVNHDGQQLGPYSLEEVHGALKAGSLNPGDLAWVEGTPAWVALSTVVSAPAGFPPAFGSATPPYGAQPFGQQQMAAPTSGLAITSLVLGILSFLCLGFGFLTAIPAVICGHIARSKVRNSLGREQGAGLALAGLICGYIYLALVPIVIMIAIPNITMAVNKAKEVEAINNGREIAGACREYASENDGKYPPTLDELVPNLLESKTLQSPGSDGFDYLAAGKTNPPDEMVLVVGKKVNKQGERVVARVSGESKLEKYNP